MDLHAGATLLIDGARAMGLAQTTAARSDAAWKIMDGASVIRGLAPEVNPEYLAFQPPGGHMFVRMADDIVTKATTAASGHNVGRSIESAMDGASFLLRRAHGTNVRPVVEPASTPPATLFSSI